MTSALATQFHIYLPYWGTSLFSVIVNLRFKLYLWPEVRARAQAALLLLGARTLD